jgi:hypothetical protein
VGLARVSSDNVLPILGSIISSLSFSHVCIITADFLIPLALRKANMVGNQGPNFMVVGSLYSI